MKQHTRGEDAEIDLLIDGADPAVLSPVLRGVRQRLTDARQGAPREPFVATLRSSLAHPRRAAYARTASAYRPSPGRWLAAALAVLLVGGLGLATVGRFADLRQPLTRQPGHQSGGGPILAATPGLPATPRAGPTSSTCWSGGTCTSVIGVAFNLPPGWAPAHSTRYPPNVLALQSAAAGKPGPVLHMSITLEGSYSGCSDAQAAKAVARAHSVRVPVKSTGMTVGGEPAFILRGLPGEPDYGLTIVVSHVGSLYEINTFDHARQDLTSQQHWVVKSLRFVPTDLFGRAPFHDGSDPIVTGALAACAAKPAVTARPRTIGTPTVPS